MNNKTTLLTRLGYFPKQNDPGILIFISDINNKDTYKEIQEEISEKEGRIPVYYIHNHSVYFEKNEKFKIYPLPICYRNLFRSLKIRLIISDSPSKPTITSAKKSLVPIIPSSSTIIDIRQAITTQKKWENTSWLKKTASEKITNKINDKNHFGGIKKIVSIDMLNKRLNYPKIILCLGNGPSSEYEQVKIAKHDVLFRVNHRWLSGNSLTMPDVVFTGIKESMRKIKNSIISIKNDAEEKKLISTRLKNIFFGKLEYFYFSNTFSDKNDNLQPTTGALMIAVAGRLQPDKLIIAGIDLFKHPEGAYPGDPQTPNAYTSFHHVDHEKKIIFNELEKFKGEIVIFSEVLKKEWEQHLKNTRSNQSLLK